MHVLGKCEHYCAHACVHVQMLGVTCDLHAHIYSACIHVLNIWASASMCVNVVRVHMCSACVLCMCTFIVHVQIGIIDAHVVYMYVYNMFTCI